MGSRYNLPHIFRNGHIEAVRSVWQVSYKRKISSKETLAALRPLRKGATLPADSDVTRSTHPAKRVDVNIKQIGRIEYPAIRQLNAKEQCRSLLPLARPVLPGNKLAVL